MKNKIYITLCTIAFIGGNVCAQEVPSDADISVSEVVAPAPNTVIPASSIVIPASDVVIPAEAGIQDQESSKADEINVIQEPVIESLIVNDIENITIDPVVVVSTSTQTNSTSTNLVVEPGNTIQIFIRNGAVVVVDTSVNINEEETISVTDMNGVTHEISSQSVLAYLIKADKESTQFDITKLQYFDGFGSFYLKCVSISGQEYCDNWQYLVNGFSPWTGIDQTPVNADDMIGIYFGNPYQVVFSVNEFLTGVPFVATAQQYEYQTNAWLPRTGVTLGVTVPNPNDPWSPLELITTPVDILGNATFTIATSGEYMIGVKDDYYYPTYSITVSTSTVASTTDSGSTSGGGGSKKTEFDVPAAINFIKNLQATNGSYGGSELYSDWVGVTFGATDTNDSQLLSYLLSKSRIKDITTENERRAMTALALGKNPYKFNGVNYVQSIIDDFDGTQIGDKSLVNDDIFGVLVLGKSGYQSTDEQIQKTISFILSKQSSNGSWENSYDLTAAAVQSLIQFEDVSGVSNALSKAKIYLKNGQQADGGWGSVYTTAWVAQAMHDLGESWSKNSKTVQDYFLNTQQSDGGVLKTNETEENRIWATSYVIPAVLELSWNDILQSVSRPTTNNNSNSSDSNATSTQDVIATSTSPVIEENNEEATSTPTILPNLTEKELSKTQEFILSNDEQTVKEDSAATTTSTTTNSNTNNQTPWFKVWWVYVMGGVIVFGLGIRLIVSKM